MFVHTLGRTDQHLIQDFMLTTITLLLARHAEHAEWEFELTAMDDKSREGSSQGHAFLFIYTVARHYVAVTRPHEESNTSETGPDRDESTFFGDFIDAVASNDPKRALTRWFSTNISAETDIAAPVIRQLACEFLDRLTRPAPDFIASDVAISCPPRTNLTISWADARAQENSSLSTHPLSLPHRPHFLRAACASSRSAVSAKSATNAHLNHPWTR